MATDPYSSCMCGSGKKFKWCCQEIHGEVDRAFEQHNAGQHEAALRVLEKLTADHGGNPEAWGRYSQLLAINGKLEEAEAALDKAFGVNPSYAFGLFLRGQYRLQEGELVGALLLFRKAADAYSPDAVDPLSALYELIGDLEMRHNRPVAARAALQRTLKLQPAHAEMRQQFDGMFGDTSRLPACASREYAFRTSSPAPAGLAELLGQAATGRLADARDAFAKLTESHPADPAAWFNLGLAKAWLGDNLAAIEALNRSIEIDADEARAAEAWTLCEVLRCGDGLENDGDYCEHRAVFTVRDAAPVTALLQIWEQKRRMVGLRANPEQGMLTGLVLEDTKTLIESADGPTTAKLGAYMLVAGAMMQLWHPNPETLENILNEVVKQFGPTAPPIQRQRGPAMFSDVVIEGMIFPTGAVTELEAEMKVREAAAAHFEEKWIHQPLKALNGTAPVDATGHATLRKKLRGVVTFLEECAAPTSLRLYDFNRLRRKLGLGGGAEPIAAGVGDITAMSVAELAALAAGELSTGQLGDAFRAALKLDAKEVAGKFAELLLAKPADSTDRWVYFNHLITQAQAESRFDDALGLVDEGEKTDCEHNEGRRRNDFELRKGQLLAKRGDASAAADVFDRLIDRVPDELKYLETATKAMLDLKQAGPSKKFSEAGLAKARSQNNRDAEEYFSELADAARRLG